MIIKKKILTEATKTEEEKKAQAAADAIEDTTGVETDITNFDDPNSKFAVSNLERELDKTFFTNRQIYLSNLAVMKMAARHGKPVNRSQLKTTYKNLMVTGISGVGKTQIVTKWAHKRGVILVRKDASILNPEDLNGFPVAEAGEGKYAVRLGSSEFNSLSTPKQYAILFLDEFNRSEQSVRSTMLTLVQDHLVPDPNASDGSEKRYLPNFLFTLVCMNPKTGTYNVDALDPADQSRYSKVTQDASDKYEWGNYYINSLRDINKSLAEYLEDRKKDKKDADVDLDSREEDLLGMDAEDIDAVDDQTIYDMMDENARRIELARALVLYRNFHFDTDDEAAVAKGSPLVFRTLEMALTGSDGTVDDFINEYKKACNLNKLRTVTDALVPVKEKVDKANAGFHRGAPKTAAKAKSQSALKGRSDAEKADDAEVASLIAQMQAKRGRSK